MAESVLYEVSFSEVAQAAEGHAVVTDTRRTRWYSWPQVGFCALIETGGESVHGARIKDAYIFPEHREAGRGTQMLLELMEIADLLGYRRLEAFTLNPRWFEKNGWRRTGLQLLSNGAWKVEIG